MAKPQIENGHVKIAHDLYRAIARARLSPSERACWDCIADHTYGWAKKKAPISRSQFVEFTGYGLGSINRALKTLRDRNMVTWSSGRPARWGVQKDYDKWTTKVSNMVDRIGVQHGGHQLSNKQEASTEEPNGPSAGEVANEVVAVVMELGLNGVRPSTWAKQHRAAERMSINADEARRLCVGMRRLFPWSGGTPFDVFDLERNRAKVEATLGQPTEKQVMCNDCGGKLPESQALRAEHWWLCRPCARTYGDYQTLLARDDRRRSSTSQRDGGMASVSDILDSMNREKE